MTGLDWRMYEMLNGLGRPYARATALTKILGHNQIVEVLSEHSANVQAGKATAHARVLVTFFEDCMANPEVSRGRMAKVVARHTEIGISSDLLQYVAIVTGNAYIRAARKHDSSMHVSEQEYLTRLAEFAAAMQCEISDMPKDINELQKCAQSVLGKVSVVTPSLNELVGAVLTTSWLNAGHAASTQAIAKYVVAELPQQMQKALK